MTDWHLIVSLIGAGVTLVATNLGMLRWLLDRHEKRELLGTEQVQKLAGELTELRVHLPLEYVRREDWIRFSSTLDAKLDGLRAEVRDELADLKVRWSLRPS